MTAKDFVDQLWLTAAFFPFAWLSVNLVLAYVSKWPKLAATYRANRQAIGERYLWCSARINGMYFGPCINLTLNAEGVVLSPNLLYKLAKPDLMLPWDFATKFHRDPLWSWRRVFEFDVDRIPITLSLPRSAEQSVPARVPREGP